ncbi:MAG: response regulator, partial [Deltaproteobacteria bacterium]
MERPDSRARRRRARIRAHGNDPLRDDDVAAGRLAARSQDSAHGCTACRRQRRRVCDGRRGRGGARRRSGRIAVVGRSRLPYNGADRTPAGVGDGFAAHEGHIVTKRAALLVEDNSSHVELISDELLPVLEGWQLDVVSTVAEARRRITSQPYDLFVLDFRLPDGDGIQLLREIR